MLCSFGAKSRFAITAGGVAIASAALTYIDPSPSKNADGIRNELIPNDVTADQTVTRAFEGFDK
jgi:hypothetical protein